jgi:hypothetical protein
VSEGWPHSRTAFCLQNAPLSASAGRFCCPHPRSCRPTMMVILPAAPTHAGSMAGLIPPSPMHLLTPVASAIPGGGASDCHSLVRMSLAVSKLCVCGIYRPLLLFTSDPQVLDREMDRDLPPQPMERICAPAASDLASQRRRSRSPRGPRTCRPISRTCRLRISEWSALPPCTFWRGTG